MTDEALGLIKASLEDTFKQEETHGRKTFFHDREYSWLGLKNVKIVPEFNTGAVSLYEDDMVWVEDAEDPTKRYHIPAAFLDDA